MQPSVLTTLAYATGLTIRRWPADGTRAEPAAQPLVLAATAVALTSFGLATLTLRRTFAGLLAVQAAGFRLTAAVLRSPPSRSPARA